MDYKIYDGKVRVELKKAIKIIKDAGREVDYSRGDSFKIVE